MRFLEVDSGLIEVLRPDANGWWAVFVFLCNRGLVSTSSSEIMPVCAIVGGYLAQDILKTLSGKDAPILNYFLYSGMEGNVKEILALGWLCTVRSNQ